MKPREEAALDRKIKTSSIAELPRSMRLSRRLFRWRPRLLIVGLCAALLAGLATTPAAAERRLAFAVAGVVEAVLVRPGAKVAKGTALARLDLRPLAAQARAAEAAATAATLEFDLATANMERVQQLYDDLSTSKEELERASLRAARAEAAKLQAMAESEIAAWRLERGTLSAPVAGVVQSITGYIGLVVDPSARFTPVVIMK